MLRQHADTTVLGVGYARLVKKLGGVALVAAVLLLAGCSSSQPVIEDATSGAAPASPTAEPSRTASSTPTASADASALCAAYEGAPNAQADGGAIEAQVAAVPLPQGIQLTPGVQTITSVENPGSFETVVRVCSESLTEDALIEIGNAIAVPLSQSAAGDTLSVLVVSGWSPDGDTLKQDETITTEFQMYTWNPNAAVPLSSNWE